jgi:diacylglycerol kinase (ATP)
MTQIAVIRNAKSGLGSGSRPVDELLQRLSSKGHDLCVLEGGPSLTRERLTGELNGHRSEVCIIAGGDGTVHFSLAALAETGVPFYHMPMGTENLFARQFGMTRGAERIERAIAARDVRQIDLGFCDARPFVLMFSLGMDSAIVQRVAAVRTGGVHKFDYLRHGIREAFSARIPTVTVVADGKEVVQDRKGLLLIANSRQYAARLDPCRGADMADGLVDVMFMPHRTALGLLPWLLMTKLGVHVRWGRPVAARAKNVRVIVHEAGPPDRDCPYQLDGECVTLTPREQAKREITVCVAPGALRVLMPSV